MFRFTEQVPRRWLAAGTGAVMLAAVAIALAGCGASAHHESATAAVTRSATTGGAGSTSAATRGLDLHLNLAGRLECRRDRRRP